ncbi:MAG: DUF1330 domain-containing protein [Ignavibacteriae bacterium]|nr:DUF1330 domain-containing protein [Ignavibacteriota bacterium]MCB9216834.1 DUF1330 domain-containing protein [Ignavibacteria bacterium]
MAAYVVATYTINDPEGYGPYVPGVIPLLQKHGAEILAADYETKVLEGSADTVTVILKFESEEAAESWYNDPDYVPVKQVRLDSSTGSVVLAKEFVMPSA